MANISQSESAVFPTPQPWNKTVRDRWRELISSSSLPMKWARKTNLAFSTSGPSYSPTIAFVVAQRLILKHWLLVFDEVQLLDVSSATLLADVLSWFWRMGGVIVGTSNKVPDDLYRNGVQRERLEPFVEAMKVRCPVISMRTDRDWRQVRAAAGTERTWYRMGQGTDFERKLVQLCDDEHAAGSGEVWILFAILRGPLYSPVCFTPALEPSARTLRVFGRAVHVPWTVGGICRFTFDELCEEVRDFLAGFKTAEVYADPHSSDCSLWVPRIT